MDFRFPLREQGEADQFGRTRYEKGDKGQGDQGFDQREASVSHLVLQIF